MDDLRNSQASINSPFEINRQSFFEESKNSRLILTDVVSGLNEPFIHKESDNKSCANFFINPQLWLLITSISIICALSAFMIDVTCLGLSRARKSLTEDFHPVFQFLFWVLYCLFFLMIAASIGKFVSKDAEGSGIPEIKAIIGGAEIHKFLSKITLCGKVVGLIAANTAGLSIGREGPFIHISCIIAEQVSSLPFFKTIVNPARKKQILAIAVAVGVSVTFGATIGGLLFSIEVTATYYNVGNLWKSLYAAFLCSLIFKFFEIDELTNLITSRHYADATLGIELIPFVVQGALFGLIGSSFVHLTGLVVYVKKKNSTFWVFQRYTYSIIACLICSITIYCFSIFQVGDRGIISHMFKPEPLSMTLKEYSIGSIIVYIIGKYFMTIISISCPIPCGVFTPIFALGAVLGRMYGEVCHNFLSSTHPGVYALVGAACLTSSVTHTISVIIIVFELSGQINYLPFMLIAVLASYAVTVVLSSNIYDLLITLKKLPYMPSLRDNNFYKQNAKDLMTNIEKSLENVTSMRNIWLAIISNAFTLTHVPIVDDSGFIIAEVSVQSLLKFTKSEYLKIRDSLLNRVSYDRYIQIVEQIIIDEADLFNWQACQEVLCEFVGNQQHLEPQLSKFWKNKILLQYSVEVEYSPITINQDASIVKVHYLFIVLSLFQVYVLQRGKLTGVITRDSFLKLSS